MSTLITIRPKPPKPKARLGWLPCRGCPATFAPLRSLLRVLEQHATADARWYLFSFEMYNLKQARVNAQIPTSLDYGGVESRFPTKIKDGKEEEGTPVELANLHCRNCGMHAGWRIVSEHGGEPRMYAQKYILLGE